MKLTSARWFPLIVVVAGVIAYAQDTLRVKVETVQVYANVTDLNGRFVTELKPENFRVFEDGKEQRIDGFTFDDSPVSLGVLIDVNGLMGDNFALAKQGALEFLRAGNLRDEYFVVEYNDKPQLTVDYTRDLSALEKQAVPALRPSKNTAVLDSLQFALEKLRSAKNPRRAVLVLSSAGVMKSKNKTSQVRDLARKLDVQLLGVTILAPDRVFCPALSSSSSYCAIVEELGTDHRPGSDVMDDVDADGFAVDSPQDFVAICRRIAVGIRNQYILGYASTNPVHNGKYRRLEVKLNVKGVRDLQVHSRAGYYAMEPERGMQ